MRSRSQSLTRNRNGSCISVATICSKLICSSSTSYVFKMRRHTLNSVFQPWTRKWSHTLYIFQLSSCVGCACICDVNTVMKKELENSDALMLSSLKWSCKSGNWIEIRRSNW